MKFFLSILSKVLSDSATGLINPWLKSSQYAKYLPLLGKVFTIADPIVNAAFPTMSKNDLYQIFKFAVRAATDGQFSPEEVNGFVQFALDRYDVTKAVTNTAPPVKPIEEIRANLDQAVSDFKTQQAAALLGTQARSIGQ